MTTGSVIHDAFTIERSYLATPQRVFAAFASAGARSIWGGIVDVPEADKDARIAEFDFRVGGLERHCFKYKGTTYRFEARYYDIVPDQRIICVYEMYAGEARISVSVATIEFARSGDGTALAWTEQRAFLNSADRRGLVRRIRQPGEPQRLAG